MRTRPARRRRPSPVVAVTRETQLRVDGAAALQTALLLPASANHCAAAARSTAAALAESSRRRTGRRALGVCPSAPSRASATSGTFSMFIVSIAWIATSGSGVVRQRAVVLGKGSVAGLVQRLARANAWIRSRGSGSRSTSRVSTASSVPKPSSVQSAWKRASRLPDVPDDRLQAQASTGPVLLENDQLLRRVAPPAVGVRQMPDELCRRLVEHSRTRAIARDAVVRSDARRGRAAGSCPVGTA